MKVYFDIITNHTADVIQPAEGAQAVRHEGRRALPDRRRRRRSTIATTPGPDTFPALSPASASRTTPSSRRARVRKVPEWLNDTTLYHNRGDTTFTGEDSYYGDFFGLDDLFTEHPRVVDGMIDIYKTLDRATSASTASASTR